MAASNCSPVSYPRLPPTHQHPMWQAWDMAAEMCLLQLPGLLADASAEFVPSTFFSEQLTAFELWLAHGSADKRPPEQLPIVLQVRAGRVPACRRLHAGRLCAVPAALHALTRSHPRSRPCPAALHAQPPPTAPRCC